MSTENDGMWSPNRADHKFTNYRNNSVTIQKLNKPINLKPSLFSCVEDTVSKVIVSRDTVYTKSHFHRTTFLSLEL